MKLWHTMQESADDDKTDTSDFIQISMHNDKEPC